MTVHEQLAYEARVKMRQAAIAGIAGVFLVLAAIVQISGIHTKVDELTLDLITEHKRFPLDLIGAIVNSFGLLALAATLNYLFRISRARNAEIAPWIRWLAVAGATGSAFAAIIYAAVIAGKADDFVNHGSQTYMQANALTSGGLIVALPLIAQFASLLLTAGFIWVSLNAMRVGLLTRFMGYIGIFAGVLVLFPIGSPVPVVQGFWLIAVAYLISGRWPSGLPAAWSSGQMERWPTAAEQREARERDQNRSPAQKAKAEQRAARAAKRAGVVTSTATDVDDAPAGSSTSPSPSTSAAKRKKKRRK